MTPSDKTLLGICILSLSIGFVQHGCSKRKIALLSENSASEQPGLENSDTSSTGKTATKWTNGDLKPYIEYTHVVKTDSPKDTSLSLNQQRRAAIRERNEKLHSQQPVPPSEGFDYFAAREGYKDMLFSSSFNGGSNTLSEAEKWELIESENLPW
ncbi:hypothetical protein P4C99_13350 [Pontiellaceae bacterium B1224]|nr:hypothetical protein [Pontiellaceae bacterium B1224]